MGKDIWAMKKKMNDTAGREHTPLYRSYGVTKKHRTLAEVIGENMLAAVAIWLSCVLLLAGTMASIAFFLYGEILLVTLAYLILVSVFLTVVTRSLRKRWKFLRQLKKLAKKEGYRLTFQRKFYKSFRWENRVDFVLATRSRQYEVRFLALRKYNASLFFDAEGLRYVVYPLQNIFTTMFGRQPRERIFPLPPVPSEAPERLERVVLINPVCREMFLKDRDGSLVATGSGTSFGGYTFYTASGLLETVKRRDSDRYGRS